MKKFLSLALVLVAALSVNAQKGSFYLGTSGMNPFGTVTSLTSEIDVPYLLTPMTGFSTMNIDDSDASLTSWGLAPEVGYFVSDNFAVGLGLFYTSTSFDSGESGADAIALNTFGLNPYARYYFVNKGAFRMYGQAGFTYASAKSDVDGSKSTDYIGIGIKPGVSYNLSDRFAINATFGNLGYESVSDLYSQFGLNLDMSSLSFGFTVSF